MNRDEKFLLVQKHALDAKKRYEDSSSRYANILVTGEHGTGKTQLLSTCPMPVHIDSFDSGGTTTAALQPLIDSGDIIVEQFEDEDWDNPHAYRDWEKSFLERRRDGYFNYIGTFSLDSATNWVKWMMAQIMKVGKGKGVKPHPGGNPYESDYLHQQLQAANVLTRDIMPLPCHTLITGHLNFVDDRDEDGHVLRTRSEMLMWGKLAHQFPLVFDEIYCMVVKRSSSGPIHEILTRNDGLYRAKTRMGGTSFELKEEPNIRKLLKKAGKNHEDKPPLV